MIKEHKVKIIIIAAAHLIFYGILELLTLIWAINVYGSTGVLIFPLIIYAIGAIPIYYILKLYTKYISRFKILQSKILWILLALIFSCCVIFGSVGTFYSLPHITNDGNEGFAFLFSSFFLPFLLIGFTSIVILCTKPIRTYVFKLSNLTLNNEPGE